MVKSNLFQKVIAVILVMCLTSANFIFATSSVVLALASTVELENGNVVFETYFKDGDNKIAEKTAKISEGAKMYFAISVKAGKVQNGKIKIDNANFKIDSDKIKNKYISSVNIKTLEINLNEIGYNDEFVEIELPIKFEEKSKIDKSYFEMENNISFSGRYLNNEEGNDIQSNQVTTKLKWEEDNVELNYDSNIEKILFVDNKMLVQTKVMSKYKNNYFPKEEETITLSRPVVSDVVPECIVLVDGEKVNINDINIDTQNDTISYTKNFINNNDISWSKNGNEYKVIYVYDGITSLANQLELTVLVDTKIYEKEQFPTQTLNLNSNEIKGTIASITAKSVSEGVYKGYMYSDINETEYKELYNMELSYTGGGTATLNLKEDKFKTKDDKTINITNETEYKEIRFSKQSLANIIGETGKLEIMPENSELEKIEIDKNNISDYEDDVIVIDYEKIKNSHNVDIKIINPENEGEIVFAVNKAIKGNIGFEKKDIDALKSIETVVAVLTDKEIEENVASITTELKDTKKDATLTMNNNNILSTISENNVEFIATLKTGTMENDLIKSPTIKIILPNEVKSTQITKVSALYAEQKLYVVSSEVVDDNKAILIKLDGEQVSYNNKFVDGIKININAKIILNDMAISRNTTIDMEYTNENSSSEPFKTNTNVQIKAPYGLIKKSALKAEFESINKGIQTVGIIFVNNHEKKIENLSIIGSMPESIIDEEKLTVQYSEDKENWTTNKENAKYIKIDVKNANGENKLEIGEQLSGSYSFNITNLLPDYQVMYKVDGEEQKYDLKFDKLTSNQNDFIQVQREEIKNNNLVLASQESQEQQNNQNQPNNQNQQNSNENSNNQQNINQNESSNNEQNNNVEPVTVAMVATTGNNAIKDGDEVYEGQVIRYTCTITNNTNNPITNLKLVANHENANVFEDTTYQQENTAKAGEMLDFTYEEEKEKSDINIDVGNLEIGKYKRITYQVRVRENASSVNSKIVISGNDINEIELKSTNSIKQADLKVKITNNEAKEHPIAKGKISVNVLTLTNISDTDKENIIVNINIPMEFKLYNVSGYNGNENFKVLAKEDNQLILKIDKITAGVSTKIKFGIEMQEANPNNSYVLMGANAIVNSITYYSNEAMIKIKKQVFSKIGAEQNCNVTEDSVKTGDKLNYIITVKNLGDISDSVMIEDNVPIAAVIKKAYYIKKSAKVDIDGVDNNSVIKSIEIEPNEIIQLVIETEINEELTGKEKIENYARCIGLNAESIVETNKVTHKLKSNTNEDNQENKGSGENPTNNTQNKNDVNDSRNNEGKQQGKNSEKINATVSNILDISGVVWIDENKNGIREDKENRISGVNVSLGNIETGKYVTDKDGNKLEVTTNNNGEYKFDDVEPGKYIVIFAYDNIKYRNTIYNSKDAIDSNNSDIITSKISKSNDDIKYGVTDTIEVKDSSIFNIDAGFIKNEIFDLSLNKSITRVMTKGTSQSYDKKYTKEQLAKIEIDRKQLDGTVLNIEYTLEVRNEGELAGYANEIVDYLPKDLIFDENMNLNWYLGEDGYLHTNILSDELIKPGETKKVTIVLTKEMNENNVGLTANKAEIIESSNDLSIPDKNLNSGEDVSSAEIIISVKTGDTLTIGLSILIIGVIVLTVYIKKERR